MKMYLIKEVSIMAGISTRTLRYYDQIGLLQPSELTTSGYRLYQVGDIDKLQQILLYKKLGFSLDKIKDFLNHPDHDDINALVEQMDLLKKEQSQLNQLIQNIQETIEYKKGLRTMKNEDKFNGLKEQMIQDNESKYGEEIRRKYGDKTVNESNEMMMGLSKENFEIVEDLTKQILDGLKEGLKEKNPHSEVMQEVCKLHQKWIQFFWKKYDKQAHLNLVEGYLEDERFIAYYDQVGEGATKLLVLAMQEFMK